MLAVCAVVLILVLLAVCSVVLILVLLAVCAVVLILELCKFRYNFEEFRGPRVRRRDYE